MAKKGFLIYLLLIHAFVGLVLLKSNFIDRVQTKIGFLQGAPGDAEIDHETHLRPDLRERYHEIIAYHRMMDGGIPDQAIIFIGDGITESLPVSALTPLGVNFAVANETSQGVARRLGQYSSIRRARIVVIAVGLNDLAARTPEEVIKDFQRIIDAIPSNVAVVVNALPPVDERLIQEQGKENGGIDRLNSSLRRLCARYENVHFLSVAESLKDETGNLKGEYHIGDGVHFSYEGYQIWMKELRGILRQLSEKRE